MADRKPRTYTVAAGKVHLALVGFWVLLGLLETLIGDRLFTVFCLVSALGSVLKSADELWWHGTNRWFRPAMCAVAAACAVIAGVFIARVVGDVRAQL